jgi:hypothetical protein
MDSNYLFLCFRITYARWVSSSIPHPDKYHNTLSEHVEVTLKTRFIYSTEWLATGFTWATAPGWAKDEVRLASSNELQIGRSKVAMDRALTDAWTLPFGTPVEAENGTVSDISCLHLSF